MAGRTETVRLIGIDAPEASPNDRARDQATRMGIPLRELLGLGRRSRDFASRLAPPGSRVRLELDVQTRDRYGRLLAYLWIPDGTMVNERILEAGWALLLTVPPNVRHVEVPEPALPGLPEGLQEEAEPRGWLADRMDPEDLELARSLVDSLPPARREELEREAAERFGFLGEGERRKAILELVARSSFGPDRLRKYGI